MPLDPINIGMGRIAGNRDDLRAGALQLFAGRIKRQGWVRSPVQKVFGPVWDLRVLLDHQLDMILVPVTPTQSDQDRIMEAIYGPKGVKAGFCKGMCSDQLGQVISNVAADGAEAAILGCTELPLIRLPEAIASRLPLIDPTEVLARACVAVAAV